MNPINHDPDNLTLDRNNPYPGLNAFRERDDIFFHGRSREADELFRLVERDVVTVLFGASGLGKTSLLNAGLFPLLRASGYFPLRVRLNFSDAGISLAEQVKRVIVEEVRRLEIDARPPHGDETLWEYFHQIHFWDRKNHLLMPVIVLDQFEEIFTLGNSHAGLSDFIQEMSDLVENRVPPIVRKRLDSGEISELPFDYEKPAAKVIFSLREDFLAPLEAMRDKIPSLGRNRYRLLPMNGEQALEAVMNPAKPADLVTENVAGQIVRFVSGAREPSGEVVSEATDLTSLEVEPALLNLVCRELNKKRQNLEDAQITADLMQGSASGILENFYLDCTRDLDPAVRGFIEDYLLTASGYRNTMALDNALQKPGVTREAINKLITRRLLRREEHLNIPHIELIHDVLTETIMHSRDLRRQEEERKRLEKALRARREQELLRHRQEVALWRRRFTWSVMGGLILIISTYSWIQYRKFVEASQSLVEREAVNLATRAVIHNFEGKPEEGLLLAGRAVEMTPVPLPATLDTLQRLLNESHLLFAERQSASDALAVAYSPDGKFLASSDRAGNVVLRNAGNGEQLFSLPAQSRAVRELDFDLTGRYLAIACSDRIARVYDLERARDDNYVPVVMTGHTGLLETIDFSPDGSLVATGSQDGTVRIWDPLTGALVTQIPQDFGLVLDVAFSPDGQRLAIGSVSSVVQIRDLETAELQHELHGHTEKVNDVEYSHDGRMIATASLDGTVRLWDAHTGVQRYSFGGHVEQVWGLAFNRDDSILASGGGDVRVRFWDLGSGTAVVGALRHRGIVYDVAYAADGRTIATASKDDRVRIWRSATRHSDRVNGIAFTPDGERLISADNEGRLRLWEAGTHKQVGTDLAGHDGAIYQVAESPDGRWIASAGWDKMARIWDTRSGQLRHTLSGHSDKLLDIAFSHDSSRIVTGSYDGLAIVWDVATGRIVNRFPHVAADRSFHGIYVHGVAFNPQNADEIATGTWKTNLATLWNVSTGEQKRAIHVGNPVNAIVYSPDGQQLATAGTNGQIQLWNSASGVRQDGGGMRHGRKPVHELAFAPGGHLLASASDDETAAIWNLQTEKKVRTFKHPDKVLDVAFRGDGKRIATACADGRWYIYPTSDADLIRLARERLEQISDH